MSQTQQKKMDWNLFWTAAGVVASLTIVIVGCYVSISTRLTRIETVLFMQGHLPKEMIASQEQKQNQQIIGH